LYFTFIYHLESKKSKKIGKIKSKADNIAKNIIKYSFISTYFPPLMIYHSSPERIFQDI